MFKRQEKNHLVLACENHPNCKGVLEIDSQGTRVILPSRPPLQTSVPCPDCGRPLDLRRSHFHGPWVSCPRYPDCLGRIGWSKMEESKQTELEQALTAHEKVHPQLKVRTADGKVYEANGEPLHVPGRPEGSNPWIRVHIFDPVDAPYLSRDIIDRAGQLFDEAETAVADYPVLLKRVRKERLGIELVRILRQDEFLPTWQEYEQAVENFAQSATEWNMEAVKEAGSLDRRLNEWRAKAKKLKEASETSED